MNQLFDTRKLFYIFIAIMLIEGMLTWNSEKLLMTLLTLPGLVLGLTIHEFYHARTSDKLGDPTPERQGRLTLNPLAHLDPMGTICLIFAGFGWGRPVEIDPTYYRNPAKDSMKVALAGPLSNFVLSFILFWLYGFMMYLIPVNKITGLLVLVVGYGASINCALGLFNLLPFPPLDGSKIFGYFLKGKAKEFLWTLERYSSIILIILFVTELPSRIISPIIGLIETGVLYAVERILFLIW